MDEFPHLPAAFWERGKPHICRCNGAWGAFWPGQPVNWLPVAEFLRVKNGLPCWRTDSIHIASPVRMQ